MASGVPERLDRTVPSLGWCFVFRSKPSRGGPLESPTEYSNIIGIVSTEWVRVCVCVCLMETLHARMGMHLVLGQLGLPGCELL